MIYLITGSNGSGKTLYAVEFILEHLNKDKDRPVYYFSPESQPLNPNPELGFLPLTAEQVQQWSDLPQGSIIFCDEFRHVFPSRRSSDKIPSYVDKLAEHRSKGFDFVFTAQKSTGQFDSAIQGFIEEHRHIIRIKGTKNTRHLVYNAFCQDPIKPSALLQPDVQLKRLNKKYFNAYKSASIHTVQNRFPYRLFVYLGIALLLVIAFSWYAYQSFQGFSDTNQQTDKIVENSKSDVRGKSVTNRPVSSTDKVLTRDEYLAMRTPRIADIPSSAPIYDDLTAPVSYPRIAACYQHIKSGDCKCFSQQGTPLHIGKAVCVQYVRHGAFDSAVPDERSFQTQQAGNGQRPMHGGVQGAALPATSL